MERKEAIEIVRKLYNESLFMKKDKEAMVTLIPELKESEDERIRKALINVFSTHQGYEVFFGASVEDILAWLEKQGEKSNIHQDAEDDLRRQSTIQVLEYARSLDAYNQYGKESINKDIAWLEKQGVQSYWKPSEEQLQTLHAQLNEGAVTYPEDKRILFTLYEDLMKIMTQEEKQGEQKETNLVEILKHYPRETELYSPLYGKLWLAEVDEKREIITCYKHRLDEGCTRAILEQEDTVSFYSNGTTGLPDFSISKDCMLFLYDIEKQGEPKEKPTKEQVLDYCNKISSEWWQITKPTCLLDNSKSNVKFPFKAKVKSNGKIVTIHDGELSMDGKEWIKYQSDAEDGYTVYEPEDLELVCNIEQKTTEWSLPYEKNEIVEKLIALAECLEMDGDCLFNGLSGDDYGKLLRVLAIELTKVKPTDNIKPKFKVGDWIIRNAEGFKHNTYLVIEVKDYYVCEDLKGRRVTFTFNDVHKNFKLWDVSDAKDGDVLMAKAPFIFNGNLEGGIGCPGAHCGINTLGEFQIPKYQKHWTGHTTTPATKEQRDILFSKMKEAGYEWDAEKKELNKIEKNHDCSEEEKQLLLKDLCARLPYGVKAKITEEGVLSYDNGSGIGVIVGKENVDNEVFILQCKNDSYCLTAISEFVPYLRPMSSMTEEEIDKMWNIWENDAASEAASKITDFLNEKHLDHHHLIEKGLALEAPEDMYNF